MFTLIGIGMIVVVAFLANREQHKDTSSTDDYIRHTRQDITGLRSIAQDVPLPIVAPSGRPSMSARRLFSGVKRTRHTQPEFFRV